MSIFKEMQITSLDYPGGNEYFHSLLRRIRLEYMPRYIFLTFGMLWETCFVPTDRTQNI